MIDQHQNQLGIIPTDDALSLARDAGLDLVEVSPMEKPPVCRIMDYGKYKYDRKKRQKQGAAAHVIQLKEIRIRPKTDKHDREIKVSRARDFLDAGHKVQFTMLFRGRERFHRDRAVEIFKSLLAEFGETVKIERHPAMEGRRMTMIVSPVKIHTAKPAGQKPAAPKPAAPKPAAPKPAGATPAAPQAATPAPAAPAPAAPKPAEAAVAAPAPAAPAPAAPAPAEPEPAGPSPAE